MTPLFTLHHLLYRSVWHRVSLLFQKISGHYIVVYLKQRERFPALLSVRGRFQVESQTLMKTTRVLLTSFGFSFGNVFFQHLIWLIAKHKRQYSKILEKLLNDFVHIYKETFQPQNLPF